MKQLIARLALTGLLGLFLSACGGGSSTSSIDTDDSQAIATATLGNPALGLGILPSGQLLTASNVVPGGPTTIPIGDLEDAYEKKPSASLILIAALPYSRPNASQTLLMLPHRRAPTTLI
ncbi:MAG: hypothetical protein IPO58_24180 [Betaproteobacteria bacterium]|nr:hypothetical protein [Betaproteobacteria bacterium]